MLEKIFSSLKPLGFRDVDNIQLYKKKEEEKQKSAKIEEKQIDINSLLYDKKVKCPVCQMEFTSRVVKTSVARIKTRDTDTFIRYDIINPYFYDVWVCPICGYAALKGDFPKIKSYQKKDIQMKISNQWKGKKYPPIYDVNIAIERYKLALLNTVVADGKNSTKAILCLKIGWMYRILNKKDLEREFLGKALEGFLLAYNNEDTPIYGLDVYSLMYLIGELNRRLDQYDDANKWFSSVITSRGAATKIKEKARDMRELAMEEKEKAKTSLSKVDL